MKVLKQPYLNDFTINTLNDILIDIDFVKHKKHKISEVASVFDIEVTSFYNEKNEKQSTMYAWVFGLNGRCVIGRTWEEFLKLINKLIVFYELNVEKRLIVYVHNLAYEFQFIQHLFKWETVFSVDVRKPLYAVTTNGIEFRCSYLLSGLSLAKVGENLQHYPIKKLVGELDYRLMRNSSTPLTERELQYIINDGLVVMSFIQEEIEKYGSISKLPLTKTGYVRNYIKEECLKRSERYKTNKLMRSLTLNKDDYILARNGFMGGFTHANARFVGKTVNNVHSFDFTSSYPAVMISEKFPMGSLESYLIANEEDLYINLESYACLFTVRFVNIWSRVDYESYISSSRCVNLMNYVLNNGRVVEADELTITLTEVDFKIILQMYEWDSFEILNFKRCVKNYLPKSIIKAILTLYKDKTELKGVCGKESEYLVSKGMLNSLYGMCVTDICKDDIVFNETWQLITADIDLCLKQYNNNNQRVLYYLWGIWVTAYARANLFTGINEFNNDYIYSDTDSIKVLNKDKHIDYINNYNNLIVDKLKSCLKYYNISFDYIAPKTINGVVKTLGVWDYEGCYSKFKTLGAKRYMYTDDNGLHITIAGVNKKCGRDYLLRKFKGNIDDIFESFIEGLHFPPIYEYDNKLYLGSGKLTHTYIDVEMNGELIDYLGNKSTYHEMSGVHLEESEYELSLDYEFKKFLKGVKGNYLC